MDRANEYQLLPRSLIGDPDAVLGILTTVTTSMVGLTALVLTIVLVVVQLAMGQFSPRIVQRLRWTGPAISRWVVRRDLRAYPADHPGGATRRPGQVPGMGVIATFVLSFASIAVLVRYLHHVGQALRISALVELPGGDTPKLVDKIYPDTDDHRSGCRTE